MKIIVAFSGGKDSLASLIWAKNNPDYKGIEIEAVFCNTYWEWEGTYKYIKETTDKLGIKLVTLQSSIFDSFIAMVKKKSRFPSTKARFCTSELKTKPMIDYILKQVDNLIIIQGIRSDESKSRSKMSAQCSYFKYYYDPYDYDRNGKAKFHTYRKKDIMKWKLNYQDDILRPVFNWNATKTVNYIILNGFRLHPLYYKGFVRVGCFPCIMCIHYEIMQMIVHFPERLEELAKYELEQKTSFFPPGYIPDRFCSKSIINKKGKTVYYPMVTDVVKYINNKKLNNEKIVFDEDKSKTESCMSYYSICHS